MDRPSTVAHPAPETLLRYFRRVVLPRTAAMLKFESRATVAREALAELRQAWPPRPERRGPAENLGAEAAAPDGEDLAGERFPLRP